MLLLSRKVHESLVLNDNIIVSVEDIRGDNVRLGFKGPREMTVYRYEQHPSLNPVNDPQSDTDDPYRTFVGKSLPLRKGPEDEFDAFKTDAATKPLPDPAAMRIDPSRPLESLQAHLLTLLGEQQFRMIKPLLGQLTETKAISVK